MMHMALYVHFIFRGVKATIVVFSLSLNATLIFYYCFVLLYLESGNLFLLYIYFCLFLNMFVLFCNQTHFQPQEAKVIFNAVSQSRKKRLQA